jgi:alpha-L-fucosidase
MSLNARSIYGCTEAPAKYDPPPNTILTYNPEARRIYIHLLAYPGTRLACPFADEIAYAQFLHDASEIGVELHGTKLSHLQNFYESGCENVSYLSLPPVKPDVLIPVIEVILTSKERTKQ